MNNIKCLYALSSMCRGTLAQHGHTLCSYSQPVNWFNAVSFILRSFKPSVNHEWSRLPTNPALHQNQIRLLPQKKPDDRYPWQKPMCAGWGVGIFFKSRWWWLHGRRLAPAGLCSVPQGEPPGTPCLRAQQSRHKTFRGRNGEQFRTTLQHHPVQHITINGDLSLWAIEIKLTWLHY